MNWQDYLALALFIAAGAAIALRAYRALFGAANSTCGSGCGSCSAKNPAHSGPAALLTIGSGPNENHAR